MTKTCSYTESVRLLSPALVALNRDAFVVQDECETTADLASRHAATVRLIVTNALPGPVAGNRCDKPTPANRRSRHCTRIVAVRRLAVSGKADAIAVTANVLGRAPPPIGRYRLTATPTSPSGTNGTAAPRHSQSPSDLRPTSSAQRLSHAGPPVIQICTPAPRRSTPPHAPDRHDLLPVERTCHLRSPIKSPTTALPVRR